MPIMEGQCAGGGTAAIPLSADGSSVVTSAGAVPTGGATAAKQDTGNTSIASVDTKLTSTNTKLDTLHTDVAALQAALQDPTTYTAITPSDSTNVTSICTKGIFVAVTGNVNITGVGGSAVSLGTQVAGVTIPGALSRVNAATTATVFGLSGP